MADEQNPTTWRPIAEAPRDGTEVDLWVNGQRVTDCRWGKRYHSCGEAGSYCDDDWHREEEGWIDTTFNLRIYDEVTHFMPLPPPPPETAP